MTIKEIKKVEKLYFFVYEYKNIFKIENSAILDFTAGS